MPQAGLLPEPDKSGAPHDRHRYPHTHPRTRVGAQGHARAQVHRARLGPSGVHDLGVPEAALHLADAALQKALLGLGVVVLGVLGDIPELPRLPDAIRDLPAAHFREIFKFFLEFLVALAGDELLVPVGHKPREYTVA